MSERRFHPSKIDKLDNPERRRQLPPEKLLATLSIREDDDILDLGAGSGYFALPAARMTNGIVYALDVERKMLDTIQERAEEKGIANIRLVEGELERIPLGDEIVDRAIASYVLHEVDSLDQALKEIYRALKAGGSCLCLEWEKKEMDQGPPMSHRIHSSDMEKAMTEAGFTIASKTFPTDYHYVLIAKKPH